MKFIKIVVFLEKILRYRNENNLIIKLSNDKLLLIVLINI